MSVFGPLLFALFHRHDWRYHGGELRDCMRCRRVERLITGYEAYEWRNITDTFVNDFWYSAGKEERITDDRTIL